MSPAQTTTDPDASPLFELGDCRCTQLAMTFLTLWEVLVQAVLLRHVLGDWAELDAHDQEVNLQAVTTGARILSSYRYGDQDVWVITEARGSDGRRHLTTVLLPEQY